MLIKLKDVEHVPKVVEVIIDVLLVKPLAKLENLRPEHITQLVEVLRQAHLKSIVHRDVRAPNMFITNDGAAQLNDWGSACKSGTTPTFEGGLAESSDYILNALIEGNINPSVRTR